MSDTRANDEAWIGRTIDNRYRVREALGDGGMGSVYEAEHLALGKRVALKVIRPELLRDEEILARFEREAKATAAIEHPHVAAAMDFGRLPDGGAYLVVQLVNGESLRTRVDAGPTGWRQACAIGAQIADGLAAIHARGFVHRDLTADNVLLTKYEDGSPFVHVLDLGVAGFVEEAAKDQPRLTEEGHVVGTPGYMSPEQALGRPTDPRTDLYALGVLLWEMCTGRSLWGNRELTQVVAAQLTEDPPPIPQLSSALAPNDLAILINRLLARSADDRPGDALSVRDTLRRLSKLSPVGPLVDRFGAPAAIITGGGLVMTGMLALFIAGAIALFSDEEDLDKREGAIAAAPEAPEEEAEPASAFASPEISEQVSRLLDGRYRHQRRSAAEELRNAGDQVPGWVRAVADLELASSCVARRDALTRLADYAEPATLPALTRMRETRTGCGRGRRSDCYACVREEIELAHQLASERAQPQ